MSYGNRRGPLLGHRWPENENGNGMAALNHAPGQTHHQSLRPAHAERGKHVHDSHPNQIPQAGVVDRF
jgi:hypothetical protein